MENEVLFYGGIALAAVSLMAEALYLFFCKIRRMRLEAQMDGEYGKRKQDFGGFCHKGNKTCRK